MATLKNCISLLHFDNSSNILKDEYSNISWSRSGSQSITSTNAKFKTCCFNNGVIKSNNFNIDNDITVDFWLYSPSYNYYEIPVAFNDLTNNKPYRIQRYDTQNGFYIGRTWGEPSYTIKNMVSCQLQHIAFVHDHKQSALRIYINGMLSATYPTTLTIATCSIWFGASMLETKYTQEYIDEIRICKSVEYTGNFIPPNRSYFIPNQLFDSKNDLYSI